MTTVVLTPAEAGDGLARQAVAAVGEAAATTMSLGAAAGFPSAISVGYMGDDQAYNAPSATPGWDQPAMTTRTGPIGNHAQGTIEAAVDSCKIELSTADLPPVYPMPIQHQEDFLQAANLAGQQDQQARPTSSAQPLVSAASPADSMATEGQGHGQGGSESNGGAMEVDMPQVSARLQIKKEQPAFIQTSALIPNSCGYCGTRQTSGCWRRGWDIGNGKFINLCNKCGLRHKAGKLHSVPGPTPPQSRRSTAHASPSHGSSYNHNTANSNAAFNPAAGHEAALAAAAAAAANAGLPVSSANVLLKVMGQQLIVNQQHSRAVGSLTPSAVGGAMLASSSSSDLLRAAIKAEQQAVAAGDNDAGGQESFLATVAAAAAAAAAGPEDTSNPDALSPVGPAGLAASSAAATAAAQQGLPDFAAVAASKALASSLTALGPKSLLGAGSGGSASAQAVAALTAAAADGTSAGLDVGSVAAQLSGFSPEMAAYLGSIMAGEEPAPKRRRTKKPSAPGPSVTAGRGSRASAAGAQQLQQDDSLAAGAAADALLALNRSSASASPVGSPLGPPSAPAAAAVNFMEAAATAAAGHAAAVADRETAAAVDAAAAAAGGWSPALEAFLAQPAGGKRGRAATGGGGGGAAAAGGARAAGSGRAAEQSGRQALSRQVSSAGPGTPARVASGRQPSALLTPSPRAWSTEQLHAWLQGSNCADAVPAFKEHDVDGSALAGLLRISGGGEAAKLYELLGSDLGVQQVGLRLRLVENLMMSFGGH